MHVDPFYFIKRELNKVQFLSLVKNLQLRQLFSQEIANAEFHSA